MKRIKTRPRNGRILSAIRFAPDDQGGGDGGGGAGGTGTGDGTGAAGGGKPADGKGGKDDAVTFTQADLNRVGAKQKAEGKAAAEKALAEQLGVPLDKAKELIKSALDAEEASKTEAQKALDAANAKAREAEDAKSAVTVAVHETYLERAFVRSGFQPPADDAKDDVKGKYNRILKMVTVAPGATFDEVLADVAQIKKDFPALFAGDDGKGGGAGYKAPGSDPAGKPGSKTGGEDKFTSGAERAKARYAKRTT